MSVVDDTYVKDDPTTVREERAPRAKSSRRKPKKSSGMLPSPKAPRQPPWQIAPLPASPARRWLAAPPGSAPAPELQPPKAPMRASVHPAAPPSHVPAPPVPPPPPAAPPSVRPQSEPTFSTRNPSKKKPTNVKWIVMIVAVFGGVGWWRLEQAGQVAAPPMLPKPVATTATTTVAVKPRLSATVSGSARPPASAIASAPMPPPAPVPTIPTTLVRSALLGPVAVPVSTLAPHAASPDSLLAGAKPSWVRAPDGSPQTVTPGWKSVDRAGSLPAIVAKITPHPHARPRPATAPKPAPPVDKASEKLEKLMKKVAPPDEE